jgi:hypothetical protein
MKTLPFKLRKNVFSYSQVLRGLRSCIYTQRVTEEVTYYEVFLIKIKPERIIENKILEATEIFPPNEAFGYWAWSYRTMDQAMKKFNELERRSYQ